MSRSIVSRARPFVADFLGACVLGWLSTAGVPAGAQTLDDQYDFYLRTNSSKCENLGFVRNPGDDEILPGQVIGSLFEFCNGLPFVGQGPGTTTPSTTSGSAGASAGRGGQDDAAIRRRRERVRSAETASAARDNELAIGNATWFASIDYRDESQDSTAYEGGSEARSFAGTVGGDYRFGTDGLLGLAVKVGDQRGEFASGGFFEAANYGAVIYASWLPAEGVFVDANIGFDWKEIDTSRIVGRQESFLPLGQTEPRIRFNPPSAPTFGSTTHRGPNAQVSIGYDMSAGRVALGPRIGAAFSKTEIGSYIENGPTPMSLAFDAQEIESMQSSLGWQASVALPFASGIFVPQLNASWFHEYRDDQRFITARFAEDIRPSPARLRFLNQAPDRSFYTVRVSTIAVLKGGLSAFASFEKLFGHDYRDRFGASIGLRVEM